MKLGLNIVLGAAFAAGSWVVGMATAFAEPTETLVNPLLTASDCRYCHQHANAAEHAEDPPYGAFFGWRGSMMAHASIDPVFWGAVGLAAQDDREHTQDCIRCHVPNAYLDGRRDIITMEELNDDGDQDGVFCEACHRMMDDPATPRGNALWQFDDVLVGDQVARRGPFDYTDGVPEPTFAEDEMGNTVAIHAVIADPFTGSSAMCGTCHDVTTATPRVDDQGTSLGIAFNEQRTYREWVNSDFSVAGDGFESCQDCHMPAVTDKPSCSIYLDEYAHPTGGRRHDLLGANRFMLEVLEVQPNAGPLVGEFFYRAARTRMDEFLATSATLEVQAPTAVDLMQGLDGLAVTVTNETGHKLPTGYSEGRVMWIEVVGRYGETVVWSSGRWDDTNGMEEDPQLRTYRGVAEELLTGTNNHLLLNDHWVEDTRIPPRGLRPDIETDPVGDRYVLDPNTNTWPHQDSVTYAFTGRTDVTDTTPQSSTDDVLELSVRLLYLVNTRDYIEQLAEDNLGTSNAGATVVAQFEALGWARPVVLAEQVASIPITGLMLPSLGSTGPDGPSEGTTGATMTGSGSTTAPNLMTDANESPLDDGGGCTCRSGRPTAGGWASMLLLPLMAFGRRRSRRRSSAAR